MRLTSVILIAAIMQLSAASLAQKVTLSEKKASLKSIFREIRKQTNYNFICTDELFQAAKPVNIRVKGAELNEVLKQLFNDQPLSYSIEEKTVVVKEKTPSFLDRIVSAFTAIDIRGIVLDEKGQPLLGATVKVKDSKKVVSTNAAGEFVLTGINENAILQISFIGYKTSEVTVGQSQSITVKLELNLADLQEVAVVSTGYQSLPKERATGSFGQVNRAALDHRPVSNLSSALQGMVAGMQAKEKEDGSVDFLIRGNTSLYGDSRPLIVVDGFPVSASDFSNINPNDVASVTVLKDAAAASIWGARAANGVIVVVTKRPKETVKLSVEASAFTRIADRIDLNQVLPQANSADQITYERKAFENNWVLSTAYTGSFNDITNSLTLAQELLYANKSGKISLTDMNAGLDALSKVNNRSQISDLLLQRAVLNQYNVNIQSGTDRSKTYTSMMYEKNKGGYVKNGYDRFNLNFNNDFKITKFLNFNLSANLQYRKQETSGATIDELKGVSPYELLLNPDGSYATNLKDYNREQLALIPTAKFPYADWSYNLLQEVRGRSRKNQVLSSRVQAGLNLKLFDGLTFDSKFQYERAKTDYEEVYDESTFYVRSLINRMTVYDNVTKTVGKSYVPKGGILKGKAFAGSNGSTSDWNNEDLESYLFRNQFNYDKRIGDKHNISAIAGMELSKYTGTKKANPYVYGYFGDRLQTITPPYGYGSSLDQFTDFRGNSGVTVPGGTTVLDWTRDKYVSFYGNVAYTYNNKYTLSSSIRSDASNFITDEPKLRWSPLWSVGAKWNVRNETFMQHAGAFDRLELRLTYGKNGNVERSTSTKALLNVGSSPNPNTGTITATVSSNGNPFLRWEKTTSTNLGVDFALWNNKVFGSIDLYNKKGEGIIGEIALPAATGTILQRFNNAGIINRGIELSLGTSLDIPNTPIHYSTSFNYAYNRNKVTSLYNPSLYAYQLAPPPGAFVEGRPVNPIYSFTYLGMKDGIPQLAGPNGTSRSFSDVTLYNLGLGLSFMNYEGTTVPPHTLGWVNNIQVQNFNLTAIFVGKMGGVYRNPAFAYNTLVGVGKPFIDRVVHDVLAGDPNVPGFGKPNETGLIAWGRYAPYLNTLVESSSYIECKELTLEYTLSKRLADVIKVNNVKVFAQTRDLGMIWHANSKGYNPDWLPGTNRPAQTYTFGINLQF